MRVFDAFLFYNELDLLDIRLNILDPYVDFFVINESPITFSGKEKPLYFQDNKNRYSAFNHKIIHKVIADTPPDFLNPMFFLTPDNLKDMAIRNKILKSMHPWSAAETQWGRETYQRECLLRGLATCNNDDMVIISDLDEIPNPAAIQECRQNLRGDTVYILEQKMFYYYLNCLKLNETWLGSKICSYGHAQNGLNSVRSLKTGQYIKKGGWHFSFLGGVEKIKQKLEAYSHQEFNNDHIKNSIEDRIAQNKDILGRPVEFKTIPIDDTFPEYILKNLEKYSDFIK